MDYQGIKVLEEPTGDQWPTDFKEAISQWQDAADRATDLEAEARIARAKAYLNPPQELGKVTDGIREAYSILHSRIATTSAQHAKHEAEARKYWLEYLQDRSLYSIARSE